VATNVKNAVAQRRVREDLRAFKLEEQGRVADVGDAADARSVVWPP
jgi:hypothetical protein